MALSNLQFSKLNNSGSDGGGQRVPEETYDASLKYPESLGSERFPHYMIFYINESSKSSIAKALSPGGNLYNIDATKTQGNSVSAISAATKATGTTPLTIAAELGLDRFTNDFKRVKKIIALAVPHDVQASYSMSYEEAQMGMLGTFLNDLASGKGFEVATKSAAQSIVQNMPNHLPALLGGAIGATVGGITGSSSAGSAAAGAVVGELNSANFKNILSKASGLATNSHQEQVFKSVDFREFQFNYLFAPKNASEAATVKQIINTFKVHMHPELNMDASLGGANFLIMPAEFDIEFYYKDAENLEVNKIATCVLQSLSVNYTPASQWSAFSGTGTPVITSLSMKFKEVEPIFRNMILAGY